MANNEENDNKQMEEIIEAGGVNVIDFDRPIFPILNGHSTCSYVSNIDRVSFKQLDMNNKL